MPSKYAVKVNIAREDLCGKVNAHGSAARRPSGFKPRELHSVEIRYKGTQELVDLEVLMCFSLLSPSCLAYTTDRLKHSVELLAIWIFGQTHKL